MTNWELARYLIDAKKDIDSIMFLDKHFLELNIDVFDFIERHRNSFYVNLASIVDKHIENEIKKLNCASNEKRRKIYEIKSDTKTRNKIDILFYHRDKHASHKDEDYRDTEYESLKALIDEMKDIINGVFIECKSSLPDQVTLNYVCYDRNLFRQIKGITKQIEKEILEKKHLLLRDSKECSDSVSKKIFYNTESLYKVENKSDYCTVCENGLTWDEGLQNRQDFCIKTNVLQGTDIWFQFDEKSHRFCLMAQRLGYFDEYGIFQGFGNKSLKEIDSDFKLMDDAMTMNVLAF